jgi:SAM-dependent methyltransferase
MTEVLDRSVEIESLITEQQGIRLDIGCGENKNPGFVGMDIRALDGVDIVHDVEAFPWPLPDDSVLSAVCSHVVEHINPHNFGFINFMDEVWRVMKVGGDFAISCPHGSSQGFLQDPTHCNALNETTWTYFDPYEPRAQGVLYSIYRPKPWRIKFLSWSPVANIEVVLVKRSLDELENPPDGYEHS